MKSPRRIAVLGGGISGLTTAYTLAQARKSGADVEEFLIEASGRLGGVIRTEHVDGFVVEGGPDSFIAEKPEAAALCRELGLGGQLIGSNDSERKTYILHGGRLLLLPDGLMLLAPTSAWAIATSPLLSLKTKSAIAMEWFAPPRPNAPEIDESVASFVGRHFGSEMLENIVEPLLAGIYGGDSGSLSMASVLPRFQEMERRHGSLVRGALKLKKQRRKAARAPDASGEREKRSLFITLKDGLGQIAERLKDSIEPSCLHLGQRAIGIERSGPGQDSPYRICCEGDANYEADAIVLAMPAHACANVLRALDIDLAESLRAIPYSSAVTVTLGFDEGVARALPPGFGFLVPRKEHCRLLACTFVHKKFSFRAPGGKALLRCFLGGSRDPVALNFSDQQILAMVQQELRAILKIDAEPLFSRIARWPAAMAQYTVGHRERIARIQEGIQKYPGLYLAGNAYAGIGLSDCIRTGRQAAERAAAQ